MAFKTTQWEFSNEVDQTQIPVDEGDAYLFITNARFDEEQGIYTLDVEHLNTSAQFSLRYYLYQTDENNNRSLNPQTKGTLISLGMALAGTQIGIPNPCDVIGGVVSAYIWLKTSSKGKVYPKVYRFDPVNKDMAAFATIEQYYTELGEEGEETAEAVEDEAQE